MFSQKPEEELFKKEEVSKSLKPKKEKPLDPRVVHLLKDVSNLSSKLRLLEERYSNLRKKTQVSDQNMLESHKKISVKVKTSNSDVTDLRRDLNKITDEIRLIVSELKETAKKEDVIIMQRYLDLWEPLNFVTRDELERMADQLKRS